MTTDDHSDESTDDLATLMMTGLELVERTVEDVTRVRSLAAAVLERPAEETTVAERQAAREALDQFEDYVASDAECKNHRVQTGRDGPHVPPNLLPPGTVVLGELEGGGNG